MRLVAITVVLAWTGSVVAQPPLPPGHPPMPGQTPAQPPPAQRPAEPMPPGHPPVGPQGTQPAPPPQAVPPGHPPVGPSGARDQIDQAEVRQQQDQRDTREPTAEDAMHRILRGENPQLAAAEPSDALPEGTIRVRVGDAEGAAVAGARVEVGVLVQGGDRRNHHTLSDESGLAMFTELPVGSGQAYRVKVPFEGALFASTPFQLPPGRGYDVRITMLPTTRDDRRVMQLLSRTFFELRDERMHVVQQAQLVNMSMEVFVLPEEGRAVGLPEGFMAFQSQPVMSDQRFEATDEGFLLKGSLPPGRVTLVWAYDLPIEAGASALDLEYPLPFRTYELRIESDAPPGLELDVRGLPDPEEIESDSGRTLLITGRQFRPDEPQPRRVRVAIRGIPGPGPARWVALGAALLLLLVGLLFIRSRAPGDRAFLATARKQRRKALLAEAVEVERMFETNEIGPRYRSRQMQAIVEELSRLLHEDAAARAARQLAGFSDEEDEEQVPELTVGFNRTAGLVLGGAGLAVIGYMWLTADGDFELDRKMLSGLITGALLLLGMVFTRFNRQLVVRGRVVELRNPAGFVRKSWTLDDLDDLEIDRDGVWIHVDGKRKRVEGVGGWMTNKNDLDRLDDELEKRRRGASAKKPKSKKKTKTEP